MKIGISKSILESKHEWDARTVVIRAVSLIVVVVLSAFALSCGTTEKPIILDSIVGRNEVVINGYRFYRIKTDAMALSQNNEHMSVHLNAGDTIAVKDLSDEERLNLKEGQIITFISKNEYTYGEPVTHMIKSVVRDENGRLVGYVTFGTNTGEVDKVIVEPDYVLGVYAYVVGK